jgi:multiple sugar transport system ATP-binding protein
MSGIRLAGVSKVFPGGARVVKDVSLAAAAGELLVLVGPSGCGKSTLLRIIAGLETATSGDVFFGERRVNDVSPRDRDVAMVFQSYALYPHMTVFENVAFGLRLRHHAPADVDRRVRSAAAALGLAELLDRRPGQLSGGQRQRVALGRALVREPAVFLLDEPLSNLDARLRGEMRVEIAALHRRLHATTVYVTHDQLEAMTLGDRLVVLREGAVQQAGPPLEVYARPANRFVAGFIGSPAMNFLDGRVLHDDGRRRFRSSDGAVEVPLADAAAAEEGRAVTLGVRPEDVALAPAGATDALALTVEAVEALGPEVLLHARAGAAALVARLPPQSVPERGASVRLTLRPDRLHFFDARTESRL